MATLVLCGFLFASGAKTVSGYTIGATAISAMLTMPGWRYFRRRALGKAAADGLTCYNVLIVGTNALALAVQKELTLQRQLGFVVLGLLSTDPQAPGGLQRDSVLGRVEDLSRVCRQNFVDEIVVCSQHAETVRRVVSEARLYGAGVRIVPDLSHGLARGARFDYLGDFPSLTVVHRKIPASN